MRAAIAPMKREEGPAPWLSKAAYYLLLILGLAALGNAGYRVLDAHRYQTVEKARFDAVVAPPIPDRPVRMKPQAIASGNVIGEIAMPRVGLKAIVVQGDSTELLNRAVGHLPDSALPGEMGNVALAAHRDGLFRPLRGVLPGDVITLRTTGGEFQYEVVWTAVVPPTAVGVIQPTSERALTLITCYPFYYVGAAPGRFVVRAREVKQLTAQSTDSTEGGIIPEPSGY